MEEAKRLTEEQKAEFEKNLKKAQEEAHRKAREARTLHDSDFEDLTDSEVDIRELSEKNFKQVMFRSAALQCEYLRGISQSLADLDFSVQMLCKKLGVDLQAEYTEAAVKAAKAKN